MKSNEVNEIIEEFEYRGYKAIIKRLGYISEDDPKYTNLWLTGYVILEPEHKYHGAEQSEIRHLHVYGGITYAGTDLFNKYAIGFDYSNAAYSIEVNTQEFVKQELKSLIVQL